MLADRARSGGKVASRFNADDGTVVDAQCAGAGLCRGIWSKGGDSTIVTEAQRTGIDHDSTREGAGSIIEHEGVGPELDDVVAR